jgi:hypothetical protein
MIEEMAAAPWHGYRCCILNPVNIFINNGDDSMEALS